MKNSISNRLGLLVIFLFSIAPFWAYISTSFLGRGFVMYTSLLLFATVFLMFFEKYNLKLSDYIIFYGLFVMYTIFSDRYIANNSIGFNYLIRNINLGGLAILILIENLKISEKFYSYIKSVSIIVLIIAFIVILIQQFYDINFFVNLKAQMFLTRYEATQQRLPSIYSWLGSMASIGFAFFPVLSIMLEEGFKESKNINILGLYIIGAVVAFFNKSRFIILNYIFLLIFIPMYRGFNLGTFFKYLILISITAVCLYFLAGSLGYNIDEVINERILEKSEGGMIKGSAGTRLFAFEVFGKLFPKYAILGKGKLHGFGEEGSRDYELLRALQKQSSQIHVGYLSLFYYYGLIGGCFYMIFLILITKKLYIDAKRTKYWGPFIGWSMFLIANLTTVHLDIYIMGIVLIFFFNKYYVSVVEESEEIIEEVSDTYENVK